MKKILSLLLVVLTLVTAVIPAMAADTSITDIVKNEVSNLVDISNYKEDETNGEIYLISVVETGYSNTGFSDTSGLYLYFFNPSKKIITSSVLNSVNIATTYDSDGKPTAFKKHSLNLNLDGAISTNDLFIRANVVTKAQNLAVTVSGKRCYGITEFELYEDSQYNAQAYNVSYIYKFSGYGDSLKCTREDFLTIELNVHQTSYLTGSSTLENTGDTIYSNQLNSVYFSIPQAIENKYGELYSVSYEYYKAYTTPMFFTDSEILHNRIVDWVENGTSLADLYFCRKFDVPATDSNGNPSYMIYMLDAVGKGRDYSDFPKVYDGIYQFSDTYEIIPYGTYIAPALSFKVDAIEENIVLVTSDEIQDAFVDYTTKHTEEGEELFRGKYNYNLIDLTNEDKVPSYISETKTRDDLFAVEDTNANWLERIFTFGRKGATDDEVKYIEKVTSSDVSKTTFSDDFYVSSVDVSLLTSFVSTETLKGNNTYILRYAQTDDYKCTSMWYEIPEESECVTVQYAFYTDFDIIKMTFGSGDKVLTTFGVVGSPTDGFVDIEIFEPDTPLDVLISVIKPSDNNTFSNIFGKIIAILLVALGIYLVIQLIKLVGSAIASISIGAQNAALTKKISKGSESKVSETTTEKEGLWKKAKKTYHRIDDFTQRQIKRHREREKERLEYQKLKNDSRKTKYELDALKENNKYSLAERRSIDRESRANAGRITRESRARTRSMNRASKRRSRNYRSSRRSRSYGRNNRYRY